MEDELKSKFEEHCWKDVVPDDVLQYYAHYERETFVGPAPALLIVDLYELAYEGGAKPVTEVTKSYPSSCGEHAWSAIGPTQRLISAARAAKLPIFYSTQDVGEHSQPGDIAATRRRQNKTSASAFVIKSEFEPLPGDVVIKKQRASAFYGTPLLAHLVRLGTKTLVICGETTSGCVRASAVDAYSNGFHVVIVEECCFDRYLLTHQINLFDLHHKYADVMGVDDVVSQLS